MQLHVGELYWPQVTTPKPIPSIQHLGDECDVLIVGGGISGAISAFLLAKEGYKITLIEKSKVGSGSTAANTGLIQYMSDVFLSELMKQIGEEKAIHFYQESVEAIRVLQQIHEEIPELETKSFQGMESLILATEEDKVSQIQEEVNVQKSIDLEASFLNRESTARQGFDAYGAMNVKPDISLNPYAFVNRLLSTAVELYGLKVFENTEFVDVEDHHDCQEVKLLIEGKETSARFRKVIFATGYNPPEMFIPKLRFFQINKTFVTVTDQRTPYQDNLDYLIWEVKDPYTYYKYTFENRFMIGGCDVEENSLRDEDASKNKAELVVRVKEMLQDKTFPLSPEFSYAALFGESEDNLPYIGQDPDNPNLFLICGVGGNGTVYSTIAAKMASGWLADQDLSDYSYLRLNR